MLEQQHTSTWPFCQTAIPRGRSRGIFIRILSVDRPLYWSLCKHNVRVLGECKTGGKVSKLSMQCSGLA